MSEEFKYNFWLTVFGVSSFMCGLALGLQF